MRSKLDVFCIELYLSGAFHTELWFPCILKGKINIFNNVWRLAFSKSQPFAVHFLPRTGLCFSLATYGHRLRISASGIRIHVYNYADRPLSYMLLQP